MGCAVQLAGWPRSGESKLFAISAPRAEGRLIQRLIPVSAARVDVPTWDAVWRHTHDYQCGSPRRPAIDHQPSRRRRWRGPSFW